MNTETDISSEASLFTHESNGKSSAGLYSGGHRFKFEPTEYSHEFPLAF